MSKRTAAASSCVERSLFYTLFEFCSVDSMPANIYGNRHTKVLWIGFASVVDLKLFCWPETVVAADGCWWKEKWAKKKWNHICDWDLQHNKSHWIHFLNFIVVNCVCERRNGWEISLFNNCTRTKHFVCLVYPFYLFIIYTMVVTFYGLGIGCTNGIAMYLECDFSFLFFLFPSFFLSSFFLYFIRLPWRLDNIVVLTNFISFDLFSCILFLTKIEWVKKDEDTRNEHDEEKVLSQLFVTFFSVSWYLKWKWKLKWTTDINKHTKTHSIR